MDLEYILKSDTVLSSSIVLLKIDVHIWSLCAKCVVEFELYVFYLLAGYYYIHLFIASMFIKGVDL